MALVLKDRVKQTAAAPGTGTITLGATAAGFQSFASVGNGNTTYFAIVDPISGAWEVNYGVYTSSGTTLTRNATPLSSSTGTLVNFTGAVDVFVTYPSENAVWRDTAGVVVQQSFGAITATSAALTSGTITGAPVNATDIVNKEYADSIASGLNYHQPVNYASTAALPTYVYNNGASGVGATITAVGNGALSLGGGSPTATQRVLVKDEVGGNAPYNGIYVVTQAGTSILPFILTRATDYDTSGSGTNEVDAGDYVLVISGTLASTAWVQQTPLPITVGTTAITFLQFNAPITYTAGTGLNLSPATTFNISNTGVTATTYGSASAVPVVTFNAQGQATGVTNTTIAIAGSQVSGNISGQAGSVANALTLGTYLTGGTYNGSAAVTATVDATSANTASKVVARDSSGNFSAGTITATLSGSSTSATTATNLAGGAANQIPYQTGSGATSFITAASGTNTVLNFNGSAFSWSTGTISGVPLGSNLNSLTAGTYLTGTAYNGSAAQTWTVNAASANTASTVVARDASGNFSASTITASLSGNATTATTATNQSGGTVNATTGAFSSNVTIGGGDLTVYRAGGTTGVLYLNSAQNRYLYWNSSTYELAGAELNINGNRALNAGNYNSYAPTLTGTGASGTWNINVTGSAGSSTSSTYTTYISNISLGTGSANVNYGSSAVLRIDGGSGAYLQYAPLLHVAAGDTMWQAQGSYGSSGDGTLYFRQGYNGSWGNWLIMLSSYNYNSYAPTLTGTGASGTWGINITGSAGSAPGYLPLSGGTMTGAINASGTSGSVGGYFGTIKVGYLGAYGTIERTDGDLYIQYNNAYNIYTGYGGGFLYAYNSVRSPIFYDSNNTTYYIDPAASTALSIYGGITFGYSNPVISAPSYIVVPGGAYFNSGTVYTVSTIQARGGVGNDSGAALVLTGGTSGYTEINGSTRSPIYYDYDNTAYYVNPASYSNMYSIAGVSYVYGGYLSSGSDIYTNANYGYGLVGAYSSYRYQGVYAMGDAYKLPPDGTTTGSLYGMAWSHPNAGGAASNLNSHGLLLLQNGSFMAALSTNGTFSADVRGTIFYDYNNTAYYVDPNGTSSVSSIVADNWFRPVGQTGLYSSSYGQHFYPNSDGRYWSITGNGSTDYGGLLFKTNYESTIKGYIYWSTSGFGLLHGNGGWSVRGNLSAIGGQFYGSWFSDTDLRAPIFYDYDNTSYYVDPASTSVLSTLLCYGNVTAYYSSDIKFKTNVRDIPNALEIAESIGGKLFDWTDEYIEEHGWEDDYFMRKADFGVIAQDVLKVFPVAVRTRPDGSLAVDYEKLSAIAFAAVASLSTRVKSLEARI